MKRAFLLFAVVFFAAITTGQAQTFTIYFKENTAKDAQGNPVTRPPLQAISVKKAGDQLTIARQVGPGTVSESMPMGAVLQISFPEPPQIRSAGELLAHGQAEAALAQIEPVLGYQAEFRDLPGNRWVQAAMVKVYALVALGREGQAEAMIAELGKTAADPDFARQASSQLATAYLKKAQYKKVVEILEPVVKDCQNASILAEAWVKKGSAHLALRQPEAALRAFLRIPVFYTENKALQAPSMLGISRAYAGMEDYEHSKTVYTELIAQHPNTPEAAAAQSELKRTEEFLQDKKKKEEKEKAKG